MRPALTLFLLSPLVGEVLFGAVPLSRLNGLLGLVGLYGGGALLVREIVRGRRLPAYWLVLLGLAYGLFEEGTVTQSIFDQHYRGLSFLGYYGHWIGVNWVWALFIVPYHAVFSIAIPILLAELAWGDRAGRWLGPAGVVLALVACLGNAILLAIFFTGLFTARAPVVSIAANVVTLVITIALVAAALVTAPATPAAPRGAPPRSIRRLRLTALACGLAWFVGFRVLIIGTGTLMTAPLTLAAGLAIAAGIAAAIWIAAAPAAERSPEETYALAAGALPSCWVIGFLIAAVSGGNPVVNLAGQIVFGVVMFTGLRRLRLRVRARAA